MPIYQAIVLGIVQGLTEILPISSSGHLILIPQLFGWAPHPLSFDAALHLGTAAALLVFFARDWISLLVERQWRKIAMIALASVPVGLIGPAITSPRQALSTGSRDRSQASIRRSECCAGRSRNGR